MVQASSIESSVASFERNAFRLLSLPADAQAKEIYRQQQRIQNALELGDDDVVSNFAFLPKVSLSAEAILEAVNRVERQRAVEELFWVHQVGGKFDFESGTIEKVLSSLRADAGQNTTKGSVAQHNLAVIFTCLAHGLNGSRRLDYWKDAIQYWNATLANDVFWQFMQDRDELAGLNGGSPSPNDLRSIAREVIQRAMLTQIWIAIDNREYNEIATLLSIIREYKQLFDADSTLSAVGNRMAKDGSVAIGGILDRVSAIPEGADKAIARATLDAAEKDLHRIGENFDAIIQAFGATNAFAGLYDARALALKKLSVAFFNLVGDEQAALRLVMAAGAIACDPNLRDEAEVGCRFIRRSLCCSEAVVFIEQKNYAAAEEKFASALTLSTDEQKAEILELQQGVRRARIFGNVDTTSRSPSLSTFNGIGAKFYGSRDFDKETNSYITVHWFVFFYLPIIPIACYRVADRGHNLYTIYGRVPLTPFLRKYRWGALAAAALLVIGLMINSGSSNGSSASTYTPPSVSSQPTESPSTNASQVSEKEAIEAERAELKRLSDSLDLQKQDIDQQSADLKRMQSYIRSVKDEYTEGTIPEDVQELYNTTVDDYNSKLPSYNAAVRSYNSDLQQYQERIAAFNGRVNRYNATQ
jgi:hypothetical protein